MLDDTLDDAVLARRVATLEEDEKALAALDQMALKLYQLDLQLAQDPAIAVLDLVGV
jgi:hypothetical protein